MRSGKREERGAGSAGSGVRERGGVKKRGKIFLKKVLTRGEKCGIICGVIKRSPASTRPQRRVEVNIFPFIRGRYWLCLSLRLCIDCITSISSRRIGERIGRYPIWVLWSGCFVRLFLSAYYRANIIKNQIYFMEVLPIAASKEKDTLVNDDIDFPQIRVIGSDGEQLGIMSSQAALQLAYDKGLDLVAMSAQANPPVCKIMDFGKYRFEREKREKEAKKKQQTVELKEIQLSPRIDTHDFETKAKQAVKFLTAGNKVRVVMKFKGREMSHMAIGREIISRFEEFCSEVGTVDKKPTVDGRMMSMVISPTAQKK